MNPLLLLSLSMSLALVMMLELGFVQAGVFGGDQNLRGDFESAPLRRVYSGVGAEVALRLRDWQFGLVGAVEFEGYCAARVTCVWPKGNSGGTVNMIEFISDLPTRGWVAGVAPYVEYNHPWVGARTGFLVANHRLAYVVPGSIGTALFANFLFRIRIGVPEAHLAFGYDTLSISAVSSPTYFLGVRFPIYQLSVWLGVGASQQGNGQYSAGRVDMDVTIPISRFFTTIGASKFSEEPRNTKPRFELRTNFGIRL